MESLSFSLATLGILLLLIPGSLTRYSMLTGQVIRKPLFGVHPVHSVVLAVGYSIFAVALALILLICWEACDFSNFVSAPKFDSGSWLGWLRNILAKLHKVGVETVNHWFMAGVPTDKSGDAEQALKFIKMSLHFFFLSCAAGILSGLCIRWLASRNRYFRAITHGNLRYLYKLRAVNIHVAAVLSNYQTTKQIGPGPSAQGDSILYIGIVEKMMLEANDEVQSIILRAPAKFTNRYDENNNNISSYNQIVPLGTYVGTKRALLIIPKENIINLHIESFAFRFHMFPVPGQNPMAIFKDYFKSCSSAWGCKREG